MITILKARQGKQETNKATQAKLPANTCSRVRVRGQGTRNKGKEQKNQQKEKDKNHTTHSYAVQDIKRKMTKKEEKISTCLFYAYDADS
jgi:hypothetical protein